VTPLEPQRTFDEDPLRMLRASASRPPCSSRSIRRWRAPFANNRAAATANDLDGAYRDEFSKLLLADQVQSGLELLDTTRLLPRIVPQLEAGKGCSRVAGTAMTSTATRCSPRRSLRRI